MPTLAVSVSEPAGGRCRGPGSLAGVLLGAHRGGQARLEEEKTDGAAADVDAFPGPGGVDHEVGDRVAGPNSASNTSSCAGASESTPRTLTRQVADPTTTPATTRSAPASGGVEPRRHRQPDRGRRAGAGSSEATPETIGRSHASANLDQHLVEPGWPARRDEGTYVLTRGRRRDQALTTRARVSAVGPHAWAARPGVRRPCSGDQRAGAPRRTTRSRRRRAWAHPGLFVPSCTTNDRNSAVSRPRASLSSAYSSEPPSRIRSASRSTRWKRSG